MGIYEKLAQIQSHLKAPKNQYNSFGQYSYRSAEDILEALKPLTLEQGCVLIITDDMNQIGDRYYVSACACLHDCESGENVSVTAYAREAEQKKGMDESQITGSASSYARKYALNGLFAIDDNKDSDYLNGAHQNQQEDAPLGAAEDQQATTSTKTMRRRRT